MPVKTRDITFLAAGIALFVALSMCLRVPVFENYYLCLGYVVMTVYIWCFKWYEGAVIGLIIGLPLKGIKKIERKPLQVLAAAVVAVIAAFAGILIVKSLIDSFVVGQPFPVRFVKNMTSFVSDAFMIVVSLPVCVLVE